MGEKLGGGSKERRQGRTERRGGEGSGGRGAWPNEEGREKAVAQRSGCRGAQSNEGRVGSGSKERRQGCMA